MPDIAVITRRGNVMDTVTARFANQFAGDTLAGEALSPASCVEIRPGGRKAQVFKVSTGFFAGIVQEGKAIGQPCTVYGSGAIFQASDAGTLTVGALYYVSDTAGRISDAASIKDTRGAFLAVSTTELQILRTGRLT